VLVVTIDPARRLAEAFGFSAAQLDQAMDADGTPLKLDEARLQRLGVATGSELSVGLLNPKYVLRQILDQVLTSSQRERLTRTLLYQQLSEMIYGLQEYTAYEWVTRMLNEDQYDLILLDTPPALHAKDFFSAPEKITRLMESKVFQLFAPRKPTWWSGILGQGLSFGWIEKLLGARIYQESRVFFETFVALRDRILDRCQLLARFFESNQVGVVAVATPESAIIQELEGLVKFLNARQIQISTIIVNQIDPVMKSQDDWQELDEGIRKKLTDLQSFYEKKAQHAANLIGSIQEAHPGIEVIQVPTSYAQDGFEILRENAQRI
jgi:anion-transporting  ArsA/GET3 family ATPase